MDLDEEIRSREEGEIGSESREKGDLLPCSSPLLQVIKHKEERFIRYPNTEKSVEKARRSRVYFLTQGGVFRS